MPRQTKNGVIILTAVEVAEYVLCPEQWRLKSVLKLSPAGDNNKQTGDDKHEDWRKLAEHILWLKKFLRIVFILLALAIMTRLLHPGW
ncbi:MAG TPA: hypothetical protein PKD37_04675 [Oligoflexia bacterium]|nr:hypothetical protein [Oligoflexia bacterium]HMP27259.1 hypothetical protein [Oligoflexia bacterium]